jgi:hypothetical protein
VNPEHFIFIVRKKIPRPDLQGRNYKYSRLCRSKPYGQTVLQTHNEASIEDQENVPPTVDYRNEEFRPQYLQSSAHNLLCYMKVLTFDKFEKLHKVSENHVVCQKIELLIEHMIKCDMFEKYCETCKNIYPMVTRHIFECGDINCLATLCSFFNNKQRESFEKCTMVL